MAGGNPSPPAALSRPRGRVPLGNVLEGAPADALFEASFTDAKSVVHARRFRDVRQAFDFLCVAYRRGRIMHPRIETVRGEPYLRQGRQLLSWIRAAPAEPGG
jgi:hypothetical protein